MINDLTTVWLNFKEGDNRAFEKIYYRYIDVLFRYGSKITSDKHQVKDSIQQLFLELYQSRHRLSDPENLEFYLIRALKRIILHRINANQRAIGMFENYTPFFEIEPDTEHRLIDEEHQQSKMSLLDNALRSLEPDKKELLFLKFYSGLNNRQIGELTGLKPDTVQKQLYRILKKLQVSFTDRFFNNKDH